MEDKVISGVVTTSGCRFCLISVQSETLRVVDRSFVKSRTNIDIGQDEIVDPSSSNYARAPSVGVGLEDYERYVVESVSCVYTVRTGICSILLYFLFCYLCLEVP